jgi:hypothetical protein
METYLKVISMCYRSSITKAVVAIYIFIFLFGCTGPVFFKEKEKDDPPKEQDFDASLYELSLEDERIYYIDGIVYDIDKDTSLYIKKIIKPIREENLEKVTYTCKYDKKGGTLRKAISLMESRFDTARIITYYEAKTLLKTTGEFWGKNDWLKIYVYYDKGKPIRASKNAPSELVNDLHLFEKDIKEYIESK